MNTSGNETMDMLIAAGLIPGDSVPPPAPAPAEIVHVAEIVPSPTAIVAAPARRAPLRAVEVVPATAPATAPAVAPSLGDSTSWRASAAGSPYVQVLERRMAHGTARAANVISAIFRDIPTDRIAPLPKIDWKATPSALVAEVSGDVLTPSSYALGQIAERAGVPAAYLRELAGSSAEGGEGVTWQRELAAHIVRKHFAGRREKALVRSVGGSLRGFLSDRYRRLDSRPLVESMVKVAQELGAVPFDGTVTETRAALKIVVPEVIEPLPGEFMILGVEWSNSDFGNGTHSVRGFMLRVACLNGATRENLLKQIHLGGRLSEDVQLSDRTHALDTKTSVSALTDVVRLSLGPARVETVTAQLREAAEKHMNAAQLRATVGKTASKATTKAIVDAFESEDVINLPAGQNAWRGSNAISWIARHTEDEETRLDLERLAGSLV